MDPSKRLRGASAAPGVGGEGGGSPEQQLAATFKRAYWDRFEELLRGAPPDFDCLLQVRRPTTPPPYHTPTCAHGSGRAAAEGVQQEERGQSSTQPLTAMAARYLTDEAC
jgi:hypothetical protein